MSVDANVWDGPQTSWFVIQGVRRVADHAEELNRLNVFPIPDNDTGSNMRSTMEAGLSELSRIAADTSAGQTLKAYARAILIHARGNSGVILAEMFRGLAHAVEGLATIGPQDMVRALEHASEYAYRAVANPVEGTILTAMRRASEATRSLLKGPGLTMETVFSEAHRAAAQATQHGPELLAVLRENHVVDSAARGLTYFFEGVTLAFHTDAADPSEKLPTAPGSRPVGDDGGYGWEVQLLLETEAARPLVLKALEPLGTSLVVIGEPDLYRIHIHTPTPEDVLTRCRTLGTTSHETVDNLDAQVDGGHQG